MPNVSAAALVNGGGGAAATIVAEPQLRDLKKESTAFVPAALKRKKANNAQGGVKKMKVDAAPDGGGGSGSGNAKPDLLATLRNGLGDRMTVAKENASKGAKGDDYAAFLAEVGDIL